MKKVGLVIFIFALVAGLIVTNLFSFGRVSGKMADFKINFGGGTRGSGTIASEKRELTDFHAVEVGGVFKVEIAAQKGYGVEVEADDNLLPLIKTYVHDGVLHIESEGKIKGSNTMIVRISAPNIDAVDVSGAGSVTINDLKNTDFALESSGASKVAVNGQATKLTVNVSGATKIDAERLQVQQAAVDASGASSVTLSVSNQLKAEASGASRIVYSGSPVNVQKNSSGASSISAK